VLSREVVEGKQRVAILDQALDSLVVFDAPGFDEGVERGECIVLGLGHPDLLERTLGLRFLALRQLVQDIGGLVHPTALAARPRPYLLDRLPEAEGAVGDQEPGSKSSSGDRVPVRLRPPAPTLQFIDQLRA